MQKLIDVRLVLLKKRFVIVFDILFFLILCDIISWPGRKIIAYIYKNIHIYSLSKNYLVSDSGKDF